MLKDRLREARKNKGYTQEKLAEAIGVKKSTVCGYESGNSEPDMAKMIMIMNALEVDANYMYQDDLAEIDKPVFTNKALQLAMLYDGLSDEGKELIDLAASYAEKHFLNIQ